MAETFPFRLIAPAGIVYEGPVEQAVAVGALGEFGVLAGHINFLTAIEPGVLTLRLGDGSSNEYLLSGGLTEVKDGAMTVLALDALPVASVDSSAAAHEVEEAERNLAQMSSYDAGYGDARQALQWARARADLEHLRRTLH